MLVYIFINYMFFYHSHTLLMRLKDSSADIRKS